MIYVVTSTINGWDNLRSPRFQVLPDPGVRYICFTNLPHQPACDPWEFRPAVDVGLPSRSSRVPKILPHLMLPGDAEYSIWHDANFQLIEEPRRIIAKLLRDADWAAHKHPCRDCIYQEAEILIKEKIGTTALVVAEIARYRTWKHPEHFGLWANGLLVRRHTEAVKLLCNKWWELYAAGCERDQLSFPVALHESDGVFPIETIRINDIFSSPYMRFNWHGAWKDREDNPSFWPERAKLRAQVLELKRIAGVRGIEYPDY